MPSSPACSPTAERSASAVVRYDIEDRFALRFPAASGQPAAELLDVWCPIIRLSPHQPRHGLAVRRRPRSPPAKSDCGSGSADPHRARESG